MKQPCVDTGDLASSKFHFTEEHILYEKLRPYLAKIACPEFKGICSTDILPILPTSNIDRKFLFHFLRQPKMVDYANSQAVGVNLPRLSPSVLAKFEVPLPPISEQKRIAEILDRTQSLISKRKEALGKLDTLIQSIFLEMFGEEKSMPHKRLDQVCTLVTDGTHYTPKYEDEGIIFLSAKNVTSGYIDWNSVKYISYELHSELSRRVSPKLGDVLLAKNGTTGISAIVDKTVTFDIYVSLALLRPSACILTNYLHQAITSIHCRRQFTKSLKGIGVPNLHLVDIRKATIPLPPLDLQKEFAQRVEAVEKLKATHRASLGELETLFASLQHRAFRGEL